MSRLIDDRAPVQLSLVQAEALDPSPDAQDPTFCTYSFRTTTTTTPRWYVRGKWPPHGDPGLFLFTCTATQTKPKSIFYTLRTCTLSPRQEASAAVVGHLLRVAELPPDSEFQALVAQQWVAAAAAAAAATGQNVVRILEALAQAGSGTEDPIVQLARLLLQSKALTLYLVMVDCPGLERLFPMGELEKLHTDQRRLLWQGVHKDPYAYFFLPRTETPVLEPDMDVCRFRFSEAQTAFTLSEAKRYQHWQAKLTRKRKKTKMTKKPDHHGKRRKLETFTREHASHRVLDPETHPEVWTRLNSARVLFDIQLRMEFLWKSHGTNAAAMVSLLRDEWGLTLDQLLELWLADLLRICMHHGGHTMLPYDAQTQMIALDPEQTKSWTDPTLDLSTIYGCIWSGWQQQQRLPSLYIKEDQDAVLARLSERGQVVGLPFLSTCHGPALTFQHWHSLAMATLATMLWYDEVARAVWPDAQPLVDPHTPAVAGGPILSDHPRDPTLVPDDDQKRALYLIRYNPFVLIEGRPGTGKTTIIRLLLGCDPILFETDTEQDDDNDDGGEAAAAVSGWHLSRIAIYPSILILEPTGAVLIFVKGKVRQSVLTYQYLVHYFHHHPHPKLVSELKCIVLDEFGMCDDKVWMLLMLCLPWCRLRPRVVFMGDTGQLKAVGAGCPMEFLVLISEHLPSLVPKVELTHTHRAATGSNLAEAWDTQRNLKHRDELKRFIRPPAFLKRLLPPTTEEQFRPKKMKVPLGFHILQCSTEEGCQLLAQLGRWTEGHAQAMCHTNKLRQALNSQMHRILGLSLTQPGQAAWAPWPVQKGSKIKCTVTSLRVFDFHEHRRDWVVFKLNERFEVLGPPDRGRIPIRSLVTQQEFVVKLSTIAKRMEPAHVLTTHAMQGQEDQAVVCFLEKSSDKQVSVTGSSRGMQAVFMLETDPKLQQQPGEMLFRACQKAPPPRHSVLLMVAQQLGLLQQQQQQSEDDVDPELEWL